MKMVLRCVVVASLALSETCLGAVLAKRNRDVLPIIIPADANDVTRYAAEELRDGLKQLTGSTAEIRTDKVSPSAKVIRLIPTNDDHDGFRIVAKSGCVELYGSRKRGILYAVYEVLEKYGGMLWLSSRHTVVPSCACVEIPDGTDYAEKPAFTSREPFWYDVLSHPEFAARLRANALSWRKVDPKYGIGEFRFGGGLGSCHTFETLLPVKTYFEQHPEYFSEIKGQRIRQNTQLCLTNPDVLEIVTSNVLAAIRRDPGARYFGVSQNDWLNGCTCPKCKAIDDEEESQAGTMIRFVNAIAERVEKEYPDKIIETLAYQYTRKPPKKTRARHNVMPCLCTIECGYLRGIPFSQDAKTREFTGFFRDWAAKTDQLYVWDYATNFRHYPMPFANVQALQENLQFFRENHVAAVFEQGAYQGNHGDFAELKAWLTAKWMWNPNADRATLLDIFFKNYFGPAAPFVRQYFDDLYRRETAFEADGTKPLTIFRDLGESCLDLAALDEAAKLFAQAEAAVKNDPLRTYNVRMAGFGIDYMRLLRGRTRMLSISAAPVEQLEAEKTRALAKRVSRLQKEGNIRLSESRHKSLCTQIAYLEMLSAAGSNGVARAHAKFFSGGWSAPCEADTTAAEGKSLKLVNTHHEWSGTWSLSGLTHDPGQKCRVRFRIRVERDGTMPDGEVFWAGVYDGVAKRALCRDIGVKASAVKDGAWFWCESEPFEPNDAAYLWLAPGRFDKGKFRENPAFRVTRVDLFELEGVKE